MSFETKKISNVKIKLLKTNEDSRPLMGKEYFDGAEPYQSIFISAKKKSGKSTLISNIVLSSISKKTMVFIVSSTHNIDPCYVKLKEILQKKGIIVVAYDSVKEGKVNNIEVINAFCTESKIKDDQLKEVAEQQPEPMDIYEYLKNEEYKEKPRKEREAKYQTPKFIVILDDISNELQDKEGQIDKLFKEHRHSGTRVICSSQSINDLSPAARNQVDFVLLLGGFKKPALLLLYKNVDLHIEDDEFIKMYEWATKEKYQFLYIDVKNSRFRKGFNEEIII